MPDTINVEAILDDLYASEINAEIAWLWDGGIDVRLGDPLNGYEAEGKVSSPRTWRGNTLISGTVVVFT
jgi:hypothetical protein